VTSRFKFSGFSVPNYTQVPDELFDQLLAILTGAELKVLLYVMRRTFGFKKGSDVISKSQLENGIQKRNGEILDSGTGLSRRAIRLAIDSLVEMNILLKHRHASAEKGDEATEYALNIRGTDPWVKSTHGGRVQNTQGGGYPVPPQETVEQETESKRINVDAEKSAQKGNAAIEPWKIADIVQQILEVTGDPKSTGFYRRVARLVPEPLVYQALSETKVAKLGGEIRTNPGALFTSRIKDIARRNRIDLGLRPSAEGRR
jgi:phage replication O-like protein O